MILGDKPLISEVVLSHCHPDAVARDAFGLGEAGQMTVAEGGGHQKAIDAVVACATFR
jgi:hypothetical protein